VKAERLSIFRAYDRNLYVTCAARLFSSIENQQTARNGEEGGTCAEQLEIRSRRVQWNKPGVFPRSTKSARVPLLLVFWDFPRHFACLAFPDSNFAMEKKLITGRVITMKC
jgi:hypothetical protein